MLRSARGAIALLRRSRSATNIKDESNAKTKDQRQQTKKHRRASSESLSSRGATRRYDNPDTNDKERELPNCMICFSPMSQADVAHPLMCTSSGCSFNFCVNCIESMIDQKPATNIAEPSTVSPTKRDQSIILHCPNCRSDLGSTIFDTVLLRKVDQVKTFGEIEEETVRKVLALTKALGGDAMLLREIAQARDREAQFWRKKCSSDNEVSSSNKQQGRRLSLTPINRVEDESDEWGFEVCLRVGPHESIKLPRHFTAQPVSHASRMHADQTLMGGLESAIPREEQEDLTRLMISGDTAQLAKAAELLSTYAKSIHIQRHGQTRNETELQATKTLSSISVAHKTQRRSSIYNWIEGGKKARRPVLATHNQVAPNYSKDVRKPRPQSYHATKAHQNRQVERQLREKLAYMRRRPLPARMPKYAEFTIKLDGAPSELELGQIVKSLPVRFCNDIWDGTVMDAFSKIFVSPKDITFYGSPQRRKTARFGKDGASTLPNSTFVDNYCIAHKRQESKGVRNILDGGLDGSYDRRDLRIDTHRPRVLIAAVVDPQAGLRDVLKGDVVTHLNGVELRDATVDDVMALISSILFSGADTVVEESEDEKGLVRATTTTTLRLVFNADRAIAEALKLRAVAPDY